MSAVEYKCPTCGHRLFAEPNSPIKYQCPNVGIEFANAEGVHQEALMVQVQTSLAPNFLYKDVDDNDPTKTGVMTPGAVDGDGKAHVTAVLIPSKPVVMTEEEELDFLRDQWFRLTKVQADRRYKIPRLRQEIEALEEAAIPPSPTSQPYDEDGMEQLREELKEEMKAELLAELRAEMGLERDSSDV